MMFVLDVTFSFRGHFVGLPLTMAAGLFALVLFAFSGIQGLENELKTNWELYGVIYRSYQYTADQECLNNDLKNLKLVNIHDCQKYCADRSYCSGFNYVKDESTSRSNCSTKIGKCTLEEKDGYHLYSKRDPSTDPFTAWGKANGYEYHGDRDCQGGGRLGYNPMATLDDCRRSCLRSDCIGFTWYENGNCITEDGKCRMVKKEGSDRRHFFEEDFGWEHWTSGCSSEDLGRAVMEERQPYTRKQCMWDCIGSNWCGGFSHDIKTELCRLRISRCQKAVPTTHQAAETNATNSASTHYYNKPTGAKEGSNLAEWAQRYKYLYGTGYCPMDDQSDVISDRQSMTIQKCKNECNSKRNCSVFVYNLVENSCRLMRSSCLSEEVPGDRRLQIFAKAAVFARLLASTFGFKVQGVPCPGPSVRPFRTSKVDCLQACNTTSWCSAVCYNITSGICSETISECREASLPRGHNYEVLHFLKPVTQSQEKERFESWAKERNFTYSGTGSCRYNGEYDNAAREIRPPTPYAYHSNASSLSACSAKCLEDRWCLGFSWRTNNPCTMRKYICEPSRYSPYGSPRHDKHFERVVEEAEFAATVGYEYKRGFCNAALYRFIKDMNIRDCYQACESDPRCSSFITRLDGCRLLLGSCWSVRSINKLRLGHTLLKPNPIQEASRFYVFAEQFGFNGTRGECETSTPGSEIDITVLMDLSDCARSCMNTSDCLRFEFQGADPGQRQAGYCLRYRDTCKIVGGQYPRPGHIYQRGKFYGSYRYDVRGGGCTGTRNLVSGCIPGKSIEECATLCTERQPCNAFDHAGDLLKGTACCRLFNVLQLSTLQCKPSRPTFVSVNRLGTST